MGGREKALRRRWIWRRIEAHTVIKQTEEVILPQRGSSAKIRACLQKDVESRLRAECVGEVTGGTCLGQIRRNGAA